MSMLKKIAIAACALLIVLAAIPVAVLLLVDPNDYKGELVRLIANKTGRQLELRGPLKLSVLPRIALNLNGVAVGNPAGFGDQPLLAVEQARVGMRLWPLLHHRFAVGQIELTGLRLHLQKNSQGTGNWETTGPASAPAPAPPSDGSPLAATTIEGIKLRDAELTYDDSGGQSHWRIEKLNLTTGAIESGRQVPLQLQATIDDGTGQRSAALTIKAQLQASPDAKAFGIDALAIEATVRDAALPASGLPVTLTVPHLQYSSVQASLEMPAFLLASQTLQVSGSLSGHKLDSTPQLSGAIELQPVNLRTWIGKLGVEAPAMRDPQALTKVAGHVTYTMDDGELTLKPLHVALDATQIDGQFVLPKADARPLQFQLRADGIDADRYLAPKSAAPAPAPKAPSKPGELPSSSLRALNLRGTLQVKSAQVAGLEIEDIGVTINAGDGNVTLKPIEARFYGAACHAEASIDVRGAAPKLTSAATIPGVDIGALLNALYQSRRLSGRATLTTQLAAEGPDLAAWLRTLSGRLDATVTNGALQGIDIEYAISQAVALIGQHTLTSRPDTRQTPFSQLNVSNRFAAGVMNTESLTAETALLKISGQGTLALATTAMNYRLAASLLKRPDAGAPGGLASLAGATIPFTITGPVDKMSIRPDVEGLVKGQVKQKLQDKAKDLGQGLFDKLLKGR